MADLLATSPFVNPGNGMQARRITLSLIRDANGTPREFVVQKQCVDETGRSTLQDGNWMPIFSSTPDEIQAKAWSRFKERADEELSCYPLADLTSERFKPHLDKLTIDTGKG